MRALCKNARGLYPASRFRRKRTIRGSVNIANTALAGMNSSQTRIATSAHNLANLLTSEFRPLRSDQVALKSGGSEARVSQASRPEHVDIAREIVGQIQASTQYNASLRVLAVDAELRGVLIDMFA